MLKDFTEQEFKQNAKVLRKLRAALYKGNTEIFFTSLKSLFASIPHNMVIHDREKYYQTVIYLVLRLIGVQILGEQETNTGRIDGVIETDRHIYIMEYKIGTAKEAMAQIKEKKYHEAYLDSDKAIILIGIGFDPEERNIRDYLVLNHEGSHLDLP